ncbi:MAG: hypothetical protein KGV46_02235 [Pasteurella sp.]|nr:hypothetical protein [Pasteurella sp.]
MDNNKNTVRSVTEFPKRDTKLSAKNALYPRYQCKTSLIPIYPVRYGLAKDYIDKAKGMKVPYNIPVIDDIPDPSGMKSSPTHQLQQLRQGFIYIYAHTEHREVSTDEKGKWMVFRYATNRFDANSTADLVPINTESYKETPSFFLYKWPYNGAEGNWDKADSKDYDTAFVDKDVQFIDIAYSEYAWPASLFDELENNSTKRQAIMTTVDVDKHDKVTENSAPFEKIDELVVEFQSKENLLEISKDWHTCIKNDDKERINLIGDKGIIVALQDTIGEMKELQECHIYYTKKRHQFMEEYAYPLTIGNMIHPAKMYELKGVPYLGDIKNTAYYQKDIKDKALCKEFDKVYGDLAKQVIEDYEKPIVALVEQITALSQRKSYTELINALGVVTEKRDKYSQQTTIHSISVLIAVIADMLYSLENSPEGEKVIATIFGAKFKKASFDLSKLIDGLNKGFVVVDEIVKVINDEELKFKLLQPFFGASETLFRNSGRAMVKQWMLDVARESATPKYERNRPISPEQVKKFPRKAVLSIYGLEDLETSPHEFFEKISREVIGDRKQALGVKYVRESQKLSEEAKGLRAAKKAGGDLLTKEIETRISQLNKRQISLSVFGIFAALLAFNADNSVAHELSNTSWGRLANGRAVNRTAAILDLSVAAWETSHRTIPGVNALGARTVGARLSLSVAMAGAQIIGGVLTAMLSASNFLEALENEDTVAAISYGAITVVSSGMAAAAMLGLSVPNPISAIAAIIVLIAFFAIAGFSKSQLFLVVERGFWGSLERYPYWNSKIRLKPISLQIERAKILTKEKAKQDSQKVAEAEAELNSIMCHYRDDYCIYKQRQVSREFYKNYSNTDGKFYLDISRGFAEELYDWGILGGIHIESKGERAFQVIFAGFSKTPPTADNLAFSYQVKGLSKTITFKPELMTTGKGDVLFSFSTTIIKHESYRINVAFTDNDGDKFEGHYATAQFIKNAQDRAEEERKLMERASQHIIIH